MSRPQLLSEVARYYESKLALHGPTPAGVDWNSERSQLLRFEQFLPLLESDLTASIGDYGCGYGAFLEFMRARGLSGAYFGFDASEVMVATARQRHAGDRTARFTSARATLDKSDYTVASGIFNVRLATGDDEWRRYMFDTIADIASVSRHGFAFNALTLYSDADRRRRELYYADPLAVFDHCMRLWPRRVALRHDYELYEFTISVKL
jgi:SAM-dependent methyltransferase